MNKETLAIGEAMMAAQQARQAILDTLRQFGRPIEPDRLDGEGRRITEERFEKLCRAIEEAYLRALETKYQIVEEESNQNAYLTE